MLQLTIVSQSVLASSPFRDSWPVVSFKIFVYFPSWGVIPNGMTGPSCNGKLYEFPVLVFYIHPVIDKPRHLVWFFLCT
jgi:hypothetical protein